MSPRLVCFYLALAAAAVWLLSSCSSDDENPVVVIEEELLPQPAEFLIISDTSPTSLRLRWEDVSDDERGFSIERSLQPASGFAEIDTVEADVTSYRDESVEAGGVYYYRVLSYNANGMSDPSVVVRGEAVANGTPASPALPQPPDGGRGILPGVTLSWTGSDPDGDLLTYEIYLGTSLAILNLVSTQDGDTAFTPADTLQLNLGYFWRVKATDPHGATALSPVWGFAMEIERVNIPEGYFVMGDSAEFLHPGSPVRVGAFSLDRYEVTNQQFVDFLNQALRDQLLRRENGRVLDLAGTVFWCDLKSRDPHSKIVYDHERNIFVVDPGFETHPAVEVTWHGARAFADYYGRRLPTEAEWEKAARGVVTDLGEEEFPIIVGQDTVEVVVLGVGLPYPWGAELESNAANYLRSGDPFETSLGVGTAPVGFYDGAVHGGYDTRNNASPYGVFDLAGNVYEWTEDWFADYRKPHNPPPDPTTSHMKVIRGGSWRSRSGSILTWIRNASFPDSSDNSIGFRTAGPSLP
ncbi:MAG: SUMF1/EgtB/PvdO family nonheme iron enzyme [Candidatus Eisenbacteria bacterium]|nr:SUMF1/EgtB/PvdO family nonheme iron enzyme [Candidatus Eisenbacteria bacterium]